MKTVIYFIILVQAIAINSMEKKQHRLKQAKLIEEALNLNTKYQENSHIQFSNFLINISSITAQQKHALLSKAQRQLPLIEEFKNNPNDQVNPTSK